MVRKYSTGPLNNLTVYGKLVSKNIIVNSINQHHRHVAKVKIKVYALNGKKKLIHIVTLRVKPNSSTFHILNVAKTMQYEVQFITNQPKVLFASFGISTTDRYVAAHRVVNSELTRIV